MKINREQDSIKLRKMRKRKSKVHFIKKKKEKKKCVQSSKKKKKCIRKDKRMSMRDANSTQEDETQSN